MNNNHEITNYANESGLTQATQANDTMRQRTVNRSGPPRKRKRKWYWTKPLDSPQEEAVAQHLATPKSFREFKSFIELAKHFNTSRMTIYRRTKDLNVLQRVEWLSMNHKRAGDLVVRVNWPRIMLGQVKAAIAGDTKAAQFCKECAWPKDKQSEDLFPS